MQKGNGGDMKNKDYTAQLSLGAFPAIRRQPKKHNLRSPCNSNAP